MVRLGADITDRERSIRRDLTLHVQVILHSYRNVQTKLEAFRGRLPSYPCTSGKAEREGRSGNRQPANKGEIVVRDSLKFRFDLIVEHPETAPNRCLAVAHN